MQYCCLGCVQFDLFIMSPEKETKAKLCFCGLKTTVIINIM